MIVTTIYMFFILYIDDATTIIQEAFLQAIQNLEEILHQHYMHSDVCNILINHTD